MKSALTTSEARKRRLERIIMIAAAILVALLSLAEYHLISGSSPLSTGSNVLIFAVINLNILLILLLGFLVVRNLVKLVFEDRKNILGAKLRTKLVIAFVSLSLIPTILLFLVSFQFLRTSIGYWFNIKVERSLDNALTIGRTYYEGQVTELQHLSQEMGRLLSLKCIEEDDSINMVCIEQLVNPTPLLPGAQGSSSATPFNSVEVINPSHKELFVKIWLPLVDIPPSIPPSVLDQVFESKDSLVHSITMESGEFIRILRPLRNADGNIQAVLALGYLMPQDMSYLLDDIRSGYEDYRQLRLFQNPIKGSLLITLFLITFLIIFVSIWFGLRLAKSITEPVRMLAGATHRIALGDLDFSLEAEGRDELSSLVQAFNVMTQDLKEARRRTEETSRQLRKSYGELEQRRRYIEIILQNVTAGVISIDRQGIVTLMNKSAESILDMSSDQVIGKPYLQLLTEDQAKEFDEIRQELSLSSKGMLQRSIRMEMKEKTLSLLASFTILRDQDERSLGVVIVFDDLTELEKIQRLAAWREVARRIAHEVKNPLTPIQLSAQRLRKKYLDNDKLDNEARVVFDKCTNTIISQAKELKHLVDEFSNFARMPAPRLYPTRLDDLADDVLAIYRDGHPKIEFKLDIQEGSPEALLDPDQIKRVLINLLDNSVASMPDGGETNVQITYNSARNEICLSVSDTGPGISPEDLPRLFEPYFSKRKGGTGLGLAIVNSIVADHNGRILVEDNIPNGARFVLIFPIN
ncbi:MAG: ATP-binding protein [Deltaproteobacteria bacterium]|nr:ATP-binding protein [Deltaproteobacteria bacterium]MDL1960093.1 ATP-binding protein [Deltaproteobacteria bacterium]